MTHYPPFSRIQRGLIDGSIEVTADDFPTFLYEDSWYEEDHPDIDSVLRYSDGNVANGLLRGHPVLRVRNPRSASFLTNVLSKVWHHIFDGPSVASKSRHDDETPPKAGRGSKQGHAKKNGLTKVTPETIAYAAVQASFVFLIDTRLLVDTLLHSH